MRSNDREVVVKRFDELTRTELYDILRARSAVFVVEQHCNYQDIDGVDERALHLFIRSRDGISAYLRLFPHSESGVMRIGRVLTLERGAGLGAAVMSAAVELCRSTGAREIFIEAQEYAAGFYERFGFRVTSEPFLDVGIPHVEMRLKLK